MVVDSFLRYESVLGWLAKLRLATLRQASRTKIFPVSEVQSRARASGSNPVVQKGGTILQYRSLRHMALSTGPLSHTQSRDRVV